MGTQYNLLFFGGPAIAILSFVTCLIPSLRPQRLLRTLGILGVLFSLPVAASYVTNSGYPLLILRPATVFFGAIAAISYFILSRRLNLPSRQSAAAVILLVASVWDGASLAIIMTPGFGGAYCENIPKFEEANKTWVTTAHVLSEH